MRFLLKFKIPVESGNDAWKEGSFVERLQNLLNEVEADDAYFGIIDGHRGGFVVVNIDNPSDIMKISGPFLFWLNAEVQYYPVMKIDEMRKGEQRVLDIIDKWYK